MTMQNNTGGNETEFISKESFTTLGITRDFIWYESEILKREMAQWENRFTRLIKIMEERHKEHEKMIDDLIAENRKLKLKMKESK